MNSLPGNCEIFFTQDGSPTLVWSRADGYQEKMHHSGGALSESFFIYHEALGLALRRGEALGVLSIGLGLGYNELIVAGEMCKRQTSAWKLWSFESEDFLRVGFQAWLAGSPTALSEVYEWICAGVAERLGLPAAELKAATCTALEQGCLHLRGAFPQDGEGAGPYTCVFYDAFSKKMAPELWSEPALIETLQGTLAHDCVFTTYAATGSLNRALKSLGFRLLPKPGFLGKRESTLAVRGSESAP